MRMASSGSAGVTGAAEVVDELDAVTEARGWEGLKRTEAVGAGRIGSGAAMNGLTEWL